MPVARAKFKVESKTERQWGKDAAGKIALFTDIKLVPVPGDTPENKAFFKATPSGEITLGCTNPIASNALEVGREYFVDFTLAE